MQTVVQRNSEIADIRYEQEVINTQGATAVPRFFRPYSNPFWQTDPSVLLQAYIAAPNIVGSMFIARAIQQSQPVAAMEVPNPFGSVSATNYDFENKPTDVRIGSEVEQVVTNPIKRR